MRSKFNVEIRAELRNSAGILLKTYPWKTANSLLKQFIQMLSVQMSNASTSITDTAGTSRSVTSDAYNLRASAPAGTTTYGVLIGTGTTDVTMTDTKLETPLSTNVAHGIVIFAVENPSSTTWRLALIRVFTNNTGSTIGIREVAMYTYATIGGWIVCVDRTLYSVDVPNGVAVTLTYRITVSL